MFCWGFGRILVGFLGGRICFCWCCCVGRWWGCGFGVGGLCVVVFGN